MTTHGMKGTPTYKCWENMKQRCTNSKHNRYHIYGGRGITVCEHWNSFENFFADMGQMPEGYELDRIDNDKGYSKENCRWATPETQRINRRNTIWIDGLLLSDIAVATNSPYSTLFRYYKRNKTLRPSILNSDAVVSLRNKVTP